MFIQKGKTRLAISVILIILVAGCISRTRLDLFQNFENLSNRVKVEQTQFIPRSVLLSPGTEEQVRTGDGNCLVITTGTRGKSQGNANKGDVLSYDEYLKCRIFIQMPLNLEKGSQPLEGRSFVQIIGRYDQPMSAKLYFPKAGSVIVDSLAHSYLYATINGKFANSDGAPMTFDGKFKVKIRD